MKFRIIPWLVVLPLRVVVYGWTRQCWEFGNPNANLNKSMALGFFLLPLPWLMHWLKGESFEFGNDQQNTGDGRGWSWFSWSWAKLFSSFQASLPAAASNSHKKTHPGKEKKPKKQFPPNLKYLTWIFYSGFTPRSSAGRGKEALKAQAQPRRGDLCPGLLCSNATLR